MECKQVVEKDLQYGGKGIQGETLQGVAGIEGVASEQEFVGGQQYDGVGAPVLQPEGGSEHDGVPHGDDEEHGGMLCVESQGVAGDVKNGDEGGGEHFGVPLGVDVEHGGMLRGVRGGGEQGLDDDVESQGDAGDMKDDDEGGGEHVGVPLEDVEHGGMLSGVSGVVKDVETQIVAEEQVAGEGQHEDDGTLGGQHCESGGKSCGKQTVVDAGI